MMSIPWYSHQSSGRTKQQAVFAGLLPLICFCLDRQKVEEHARNYGEAEEAGEFGGCSAQGLAPAPLRKSAALGSELTLSGELGLKLVVVCHPGLSLPQRDAY